MACPNCAASLDVIEEFSLVGCAIYVPVVANVYSPSNKKSYKLCFINSGFIVMVHGLGVIPSEFNTVLTSG